ncbi:MAG: hypothetical protein J6M39_06710 [Lachnospiraceae bacterium]|nr:hypothetical protein [Lachnospiraceae bacterium]
MYAKAHPFDYISRKGKSKKVALYEHYCRRTQTIKMKDGSVKQIYHTAASTKRGRTLGEMVYENYSI